MTAARSLWSDRCGTAGAEMALVAPLLLLMMFASFEVGRFFWGEHTVTKAVRDGARFAGRQNFASMPCDGSATNEAAIKNVVRFGKATVTDADVPLLPYWDDEESITVSIDCYDNAGADGARVYDGIYTDREEVPRVTVTASVPYSPLLTSFGVLSSGINLNASSQAVVFGL